MTSATQNLTQDQISDTFCAFQKLLDLDDEFCTKERRLVWNIITNLKGLNKNHKNVLKNISYVGSLAEGCTLPRIFNINKRFPDYINRQVELDLDFNMLEMPETFKYAVKDVQNKRGIVNILCRHWSMLSLAKDIGWSVSENDMLESFNKITNDQGYVQPFKIKSIGGERLEMRNDDKLIELLMALALEEKQNDVKLIAKPNVVNKAAVTADYMLNIKEIPTLDMSIDFAIIFKINWWPDLYHEFKQRQDRAWPSQSVINELTQCCNVIAKPSDEELENAETVEFRYSFAHLESSLVNLRTRQQKLAYMVFKIVFVKYIKPLSTTENSKLSTFLCKNTMFWVCERFPPTLEEVWGCDYDGLHQVVYILLGEMLQCFENMEMPYFFDPHINLLIQMPKEVFPKVTLKISDILQDLNHHLRFQMDKEVLGCHQVMAIIQSVSTVLEGIKNKDYSLLLKRPDLIPAVLALIIQRNDI